MFVYDQLMPHWWLGLGVKLHAYFISKNPGRGSQFIGHQRDVESDHGIE